MSLTVRINTKHKQVTCPTCGVKGVADVALQKTDMRDGRTVSYAILVTRCCKARVMAGLR